VRICSCVRLNTNTDHTITPAASSDTHSARPEHHITAWRGDTHAVFRRNHMCVSNVCRRSLFTSSRDVAFLAAARVTRAADALWI